MNIRKLLAVLPLLAASLWAASPAVNEMTLPETLYPQLDVILKQAVQQSPSMVNRALDLEIAENTRIAARSNILPNVGGYYSVYKAWDDRADLNGRVKVDKLAYAFSVTQPVFHWGERMNYVRMGEIQEKIAQGNYQDGYRLLAQEIRSQYLQLIIKKLSLERSRVINKYNQDVRNAAEDRLAKKVISEAEIFIVRLNAERALIDLERTGLDLESAKQSFARLTGTPQLDDGAIPDMVAEAPHTPEAFERVLAGFLAQKDPPTIAAANLRSQIKLEDLTYLNQKTRLRPKFNLTLGTSQDEQSYTLNVAQKYKVNSLFGGLSGSWTLFDGFSAKAGQRSALNRRRQAENDYRSLTDSLAREAQAQLKQVDFSARLMSIANRLLAATKGGFEVKKTDYARGVVSENDVTLANMNYYEALISANAARADYLAKVGVFLGTVAEDPVLANVALAHK
ncbi:MAG: TolC family protein [Lacunisphaera sp.]|nr:TolC family protein [Lacunisphaera sp.]